jgi:hypothetical protein
MMSSSRWALLRNLKKHFTSWSAPIAISSVFNSSGFGGIGMTFIADIPELKL